jgi:Fic family protein
MESDGKSDVHLPSSNWMEMDEKRAAPFSLGTLEITPALLSLIAQLDEFKGAWRALGKLAPERLSSLRQVATIESVGSSTRIEGARLSDREVEQLLANLEIRTLASRDQQEVAGYAEVMQLVFEHWEALEPTENHVKQLHRDLLKHSTKDERHRGEYKTLPNHVEAFGPDGQRLGVVFETGTPFDTPRLMAELVTWTRTSLRARDLHPLLVIALFTVTFLAIHPFQDGNGRLSRVLTTLLLLRAGYAYVPYSSLESVIEQSKDAYYRALRRTQTGIRTSAPDWQPWLDYFLDALKQQKDRLETKLEREHLLLGDLPELSVHILELCRERGRVTVGELAKLTGASRNTLKGHVSALVEAGQLVRHGHGRGTWYGLT